MYSISNAVVSYTPGSGYAAAVPGCSPIIRWGEEFLAEVKANCQSAAESTENTVPISRKELSKDDIAELVGKYNPGYMSQEEFDAFLNELVEREYLSKNEIGRLGYGGAVVTGSLADGTAFSGSLTITDMSKLPGGNPASLSYSLADANGDILSWVRVRAIMEPISAVTEARLQFEKDTNDAFKALAAVLDAMQAQRRE